MRLPLHQTNELVYVCGLWDLWMHNKNVQHVMENFNFFSQIIFLSYHILLSALRA